MTVLVTEAESPPSEIVEDAQTIADKTVVQSVTVEDAVDDSWFIRVEGPTGDQGEVYKYSEQEFEDCINTIEKVISGNHSAIKDYYGVGQSNNQYLLRIEY